MNQPPSSAGSSASPAPTERSQERSQGDPWHAFGYLVAGVGLYGFLGHLADRWLGTSYLVVLGILLGAGFGIYMTFARFNRPQPHRARPDARAHQQSHDE